MLRRNVCRIIMAIACIGAASTVRAGLFLSTGIGAGPFSFQAKNGENTPNYWGPTAQVQAGYSFYQHFDATLFGQYTPGNYALVSIERENAELIFAGAQFAWRMPERVIFSLQLGQGIYHLVRASGAEGEVPGKWTGPGVGIGFGGIYKVNKTHFLQITFQYMYMRAEAVKLEAGMAPEKRGVDQIGIFVTYVFNDFINHLTSGTLFNALFQ